MKSILLEVWVTVNSVNEAKEIAHDLREVLNDSDIINEVIVTNKISE